jgi:hypothetical protein
MTWTRSLAFPIAAAVALVVAAPAHASISGFKYLRIDGVEQDLNDRIGRTSSDKTHVISYKDCLAYTGFINLYWNVTRTVPVTLKYVVKMSFPGGSCTIDMSGTTDESCAGIQASGDLTTNGQELKVPLLSLEAITGGCAKGQESDTTLYFIVDEGTSAGSSSSIASETFVFTVDQKPPNAVKVDEALAGDQNLKVSWTDPDNTGESSVRYNVYWSKNELTSANFTSAEGHDGPLTEKSFQITDLTNDTPYWFGVTALDEFDNESTLPETAIGTGTPVTVEDFLDVYKAAGGKEVGCAGGAATGGSGLAWLLAGQVAAWAAWAARRRGRGA